MAHRHTIAGIFVSAMLIVFVSSATVGQTKEAKEDWQGIPVGMFMDIQGQQFSYVAGFMDSAIFMYHQFGVSDFKPRKAVLYDKILNKFILYAERIITARSILLSHIVT